MLYGIGFARQRGIPSSNQIDFPARHGRVAARLDGGGSHRLYLIILCGLVPGGQSWS